MEIKEARILAKADKFRSARIYPANAKGEWLLQLDGLGRRVTIQRQRGGDAIYKTLDSAYTAALSIGFLNVSIEQPETIIDLL